MPWWDSSVFGHAGSDTAGPDSGLHATLGLNTLWAGSDDFNGSAGTKPNAAKWTAKSFGYNSDSNLNGLTQVSLDGSGNLDIVAQWDGSIWQCGWISTESSGSYVGTRYMEARAKVPAGTGVFAAPIWEGDWPYIANGIENDVSEQLGYQPTNYQTTLHAPSSNQVSIANSTGIVLANAFHTYGAHIQSTKVDYYLDNALVRTITAADVVGVGGTYNFHTTPMVGNIDLLMGGSFAGPVDTGLRGTDLHLLVDYFRVWTA